MNYPSTEYLELPFLDFVCFNVYLEPRQRLENYLARLQNIAGDRPLVVAECGLDSYRNGVEAPGRGLSAGRSSRCSRAGCAGASSSRGRTSGTVAASRSTTGTSA